MARAASGHRVLPHTADMRVEAWAANREACVAEAVGAVVESFADVRGAPGATPRTVLLEAAADEDLLVAVLDEVVYLFDVEGVVPIETAVEVAGRQVRVRFAMVPVEHLPQVGALPKAVSLHELHVERGPQGWSCSVTLDV